MSLELANHRKRCDNLQSEIYTDGDWFSWLSSPSLGNSTMVNADVVDDGGGGRRAHLATLKRNLKRHRFRRQRILKITAGRKKEGRKEGRSESLITLSANVKKLICRRSVGQEMSISSLFLPSFASDEKRLRH